MPRIIEGAQERILNAAQILFEQGGFAESDMRSIAEAAGIAVGTLYNHYPSKSALLMQMLMRVWRQVIDRMEQASGGAGAPRERLKTVMEALLSALDKGQAMGMKLAEAIIAQGQLDETLNMDSLRHIRLQAAAVFAGPLRDWAELRSRPADARAVETLSRLLLAITWEIHEAKPSDRELMLDMALAMTEGYLSAGCTPSGLR